MKTPPDPSTSCAFFGSFASSRVFTSSGKTCLTPSFENALSYRSHISEWSVLAAVNTAIFARLPPASSMNFSSTSMSLWRASPPPMIIRWPVRLELVFFLSMGHVRRHVPIAADRGPLPGNRNQADVDAWRKQVDALLQRLFERHALGEPPIYCARGQP